MTIVNFLVGMATGILSGFGIGGGSLLILYLTTFAGVPQYTAAGSPALFSLLCSGGIDFPHPEASGREENRTDRHRGRDCNLTGGRLCGVTNGSQPVARIFGVFLLYIGVRELFCRSEKKNDK